MLLFFIFALFVTFFSLFFSFSFLLSKSSLFYFITFFFFSAITNSVPFSVLACFISRVSVLVSSLSFLQLFLACYDFSCFYIGFALCCCSICIWLIRCIVSALHGFFFIANPSTSRQPQFALSATACVLRLFFFAPESSGAEGRSSRREL